jgi:uncharacterized protein (DUF934 family)
MPQLIRRGIVIDDGWTLLREASSVSDLPATPVIVPLAFWLAAADALRARSDIGVWLAPADDPALLATDVAKLPLIAVDFPAFTDGRGYSTGRLLRERFAFAGELRAIGDIHRDQMYYLHQVGFDAFALREGSDLQGALLAFSDFSDGYQVTQMRTPWFRRRGGAAPQPNAGVARK